MVDIACEVDTLEALTFARGSDFPSRATLSPGGSAANTATWLARAGNTVHLIGAIGDDPLGDYLVNEIRNSGADLFVQRVPGELTGVCLILNEHDGQRTMIPSAGANAKFIESRPIGDLSISEFTHLHVSAYMLFHEVSGITALAHMAEARRIGATVSFDPASSALLAHNRARLMAALALSDLLLANADEALEITRLLHKEGVHCEEIDLGLISTALHSSSPTVVVTDAAEPVRALENSVHNYTIPVAKISSVISTTGAGDAFNAGYLNAWLAGSDIPASIAAGTILAGRVLGEVGATTITNDSAPQ
jgi:sugar/nucleoside kinase (ribokinase family)